MKWLNSLFSGCTDWGLAPATIGYFSPSPTVKAWGKAIYDEFAARFTGNEERIACFNMSEAESAVDIENHLNEGRTIGVRAKLIGNEWVINGTKHWATNSGIASLHCLACNMNPRLGLDGFVLLYVPEPWPGVSHGKFEVKCGVQADRNTSTFFDDVRIPKEWGIQGSEAWNIFQNNVTTGLPLVTSNAVGLLQGAFNVLLEYTGQRVAGGKPLRKHLSTAQFLGEMASALSVFRAAMLELVYEFDHMDIYGSLITDSMLAKASGVVSFVNKLVPEIILNGMEFMGCFGYVRENNYEKYYRDAAALKLVVGGHRMRSFTVCRQFYDLDFSSFGPGKLPLPAKT